jgi:small-conductance mechanosensitive channel
MMTAILDNLVAHLLGLIPFALTVVLVIAGIFITQRFILQTHTASTGKKFRNQMILLALTATGVLLVILVLPIGDEKRGQILSLLGIVISAGIALSSTTLLGNAMAGFMIRAVRAFRLGDFIEIGDDFGRVSDMGIFHTEIQTEDRDLKTLPNLLLVTHAVKRIRPSGTIISAQVSLGYDAAPVRIQHLLLQAAEKSGLEDPFVRILDLGDYAVTYKVAGLLKDVSQMLAIRSDLRAAMLSTLHLNGIEIVSPEFRNTRMVDQKMFIPPRDTDTGEAPKSRPQAPVFDKAEEAASIESLQTMLRELEQRREELQQLAKTHEDREKDADEQELARVSRRMEHLASVIESRKTRAASKE